jgi:hypothetical protein
MRVIDGGPIRHADIERYDDPISRLLWITPGTTSSTRNTG